MDKKDKELYDTKIQNIEMGIQEFKIGYLEARRDIAGRVLELEKWRASSTASGTRNTIIAGAFVLIGAIIAVFLAYFLKQ